MVESALRASMDYIRTSQRHSDETTMITIRDNQTKCICSMIGRMQNVSVHDATCAMTLFDSAVSPFTEDQKKSILAAIHAKMQASAVDNVMEDGTPASKAQTNKYIYNYGTNADWEITCDKTKSEEERCLVWVERCHKIGLRFPDPITRKTVCAIVMLGQGDSSHSALGAKALYDLFTNLNSKKRIARRDYETTMKTFPCNVTDFLSLHARCYEPDAQPVVSRLSASTINDLIPMISARNTNRLLRTNMTSSMGSGSGGSAMPILPTRHVPGMQMMQTQQNNPMMQMMQMMHGFFMQQPNARASSGEINIFQPTAPHGLQPDESPAKRQLIAIRDAHESNLLALPDARVPGKEHRDEAVAESHRPPPGGSTIDEAIDGTAIGKKTNAAVEDDIDTMLAAAQGAPPKKRKATPQPVLKRPSGTFSARSKPFSVDNCHKTRPPFGSAVPLMYKGCKVYESPSSFRVLPRPGESKYDRSITFGAKKTKEAAWKDVITYCENPVIPKCSTNYVK